MKQKPYNFDIIKMINEFDFNTFIEKGKNNNNTNYEKYISYIDLCV